RFVSLLLLSSPLLPFRKPPLNPPTSALALLSLLSPHHHHSPQNQDIKNPDHFPPRSDLTLRTPGLRDRPPISIGLTAFSPRRHRRPPVGLRRVAVAPTILIKAEEPRSPSPPHAAARW
ncbi:hypothetical protein U9M48_013911, partial [Paspalum notatum var. saurae]